MLLNCLGLLAEIAPLLTVSGLLNRRTPAGIGFSPGSSLGGWICRNLPGILGSLPGWWIRS